MDLNCQLRIALGDLLSMGDRQVGVECSPQLTCSQFVSRTGLFLASPLYQMEDALQLSQPVANQQARKQLIKRSADQPFKLQVG